MATKRPAIELASDDNKKAKSKSVKKSKDEVAPIENLVKNLQTNKNEIAPVAEFLDDDDKALADALEFDENDVESSMYDDEEKSAESESSDDVEENDASDCEVNYEEKIVPNFEVRKALVTYIVFYGCFGKNVLSDPISKGSKKFRLDAIFAFETFDEACSFVKKNIKKIFLNTCDNSKITKVNESTYVSSNEESGVNEQVDIVGFKSLSVAEKPTDTRFWLNFCVNLKSPDTPSPTYYNFSVMERNSISHVRVTPKLELDGMELYAVSNKQLSDLAIYHNCLGDSRTFVFLPHEVRKFAGYVANFFVFGVKLSNISWDKSRIEKFYGSVKNAKSLDN